MKTLYVFLCVPRPPPPPRGAAAQRWAWPWELRITHNEASQSVGLPLTSDQRFAETSTWQHTTLITDTHAPSGIGTHIPKRRPVSDPRLRPRGHWDRRVCDNIVRNCYNENCIGENHYCYYIFNNHFSENIAAYETMCINFVPPDRPLMTI